MCESVCTVVDIVEEAILHPTGVTLAAQSEAAVTCCVLTFKLYERATDDVRSVWAAAVIWN